METIQDRAVRVIVRFDRLPFSRWHRTFFIVAFLGVIFDAMDFAFFGAALPAISKDLHLGPAGAGLLATVGLIGAFIGALLWGTISDYIGRKPSFQITMGIFSVFTGLMATAWNASSMAAARFMANFGLGGEIPVTSTLIAESMPSKIRGKLAGYLSVAFPSGLVLATLISLLIVPTMGWRVLFIIGVVPAALIFFIRRTVPESVRYLLSKGKVDQAESIVDLIEQKTLGSAGRQDIPIEAADFRMEVGNGAKRGITVLELFSSALFRRTILLWIVSFGYMWATNGILFMLPTILTHRGFSLSQAISFLLVQSISSMFGYAACGLLMDRFGRRPILFLYYLLGAVFLLVFAYASGFWMYVFIALVGFFCPGVFAGNALYVNELYPTHLRATANGWFLGIGRIGSFLAPGVIGFMLAGELGKYVLHTFPISYFMSAIALIAIGIETKGLILEKSSALQRSV